MGRTVVFLFLILTGTCVHIPNPVLGTGTTDSGGGTDKRLLILIAIGVLLVAVVIVVACVIGHSCKKKKSKDQTATQTAVTKDGATDTKAVVSAVTDQEWEEYKVRR